MQKLKDNNDFDFIALYILLVSQMVKFLKMYCYYSVMIDYYLFNHY